MPERCSKCGCFLYPYEDKICQDCYYDLEKENYALQTEIQDLKAEIRVLEDEIAQLQSEIAKLLVYQDIVMEDPKLWSKLIVKRIKPHSE